MRLRGPALLVAWLGLWFSAAHAEPFHHQPVPLGERALGMGGAFTGLANDPSASFYNPAGLARLDDVAISASLTLLAWGNARVDDGFQTTEGDVNLDFSSSPTLPVFVGFVKQIGSKHDQDPRHHAVALSAFTNDRLSLSFDADAQGPGVNGTTLIDTLSVSQDRSTRWQGVSYAYRFSDKLSFGVSAFLTVYTLDYTEERLALVLGPVDPGTGEFTNPVLQLYSRRTSSSVKNGLFRLGVLYAYSTRLRFGAMFQPPSFRFRGKAEVRDRVVTSTADETGAFGTFYQDTQKGLGAQNPEPWELRLGVSYRVKEPLLFSFDCSIYGRRGSPDDPVKAIGPPKQTPGTDQTPSAGDFLAETWFSKRTANVAMGMERVIRKTIVLRAGLYTDLSAAPSLPRRSSIYRPADINRFGATLSLGFISSGHDLSLGAAFAAGFGHSLAFQTDAIEAPYVPARATDQTAFLFLSGARRSAGKIATDTIERIRQRREQRETEEGGDAKPSGEPAEGAQPANPPPPDQTPPKSE